MGFQNLSEIVIKTCKVGSTNTFTLPNSAASEFSIVVSAPPPPTTKKPPKNQQNKTKSPKNNKKKRALRAVHDDVIEWKHFPRYWPFVRGIHRSPVPGEFPAQRPVTRSFDVFFDLRSNKRLSKQWWGWWFETPSFPLLRHCNVLIKSLCHQDSPRT